MTKIIIFIALIISLSCGIGWTQTNKNSSLFIELKKQDSIFFERGFNQCDTTYLKKVIANGLKFYHDQGGFQDRKFFFENINKYICTGGNKRPFRKVEEKSLEVFPLYNNGILYGGIQHGIHHFYLKEHGKQDLWTSTARFTSVWVKVDNIWKLSEVLSYDHHAPDLSTRQATNINQLLKDSHIPAMGVGIIENGKLTKVDVYGTLDNKTTAPVNTIFKVASLTKPIFALTALKLVDQGLLELDEPLYTYWIDPDIENDERNKKLTPRLILSHQTGFPNWRYGSKSKKLSFEFDPGTKYQYSGEGFEYLRKAIEKKLGRKIEDLANDLVFKKAGMRDTRFWWDKTMDESRYAQNYDVNGNKISTNKYFAANAAANLLTTIDDYGKFLAYVINGAELSEPVLAEMLKSQVKVRDSDYFSIGWEKLTGFSGDEYALMHTGKDPGVSTMAVIFPKSKNGYLIFLNGDNVNKIYEEMLTKHLYLGDELWKKR